MLPIGSVAGGPVDVWLSRREANTLQREENMRNFILFLDRSNGKKMRNKQAICAQGRSQCK